MDQKPKQNTYQLPQNLDETSGKCLNHVSKAFFEAQLHYEMALKTIVRLQEENKKLKEENAVKEGVIKAQAEKLDGPTSEKIEPSL